MMEACEPQIRVAPDLFQRQAWVGVGPLLPPRLTRSPMFHERVGKGEGGMPK